MNLPSCPYCYKSGRWTTLDGCPRAYANFPEKSFLLRCAPLCTFCHGWCCVAYTWTTAECVIMVLVILFSNRGEHTNFRRVVSFFVARKRAFVGTLTSLNIRRPLSISHFVFLDTECCKALASGETLLLMQPSVSSENRWAKRLS